jgi:urease beta subunit
MHEMGLAHAILAVTVDIAGDRPVTRVAVSVGEHQAVSADSLEFSFQLLCEGTIAAGATLGVRTVPGERVLVDEVEVGGDQPAVIRRADVEVVEPPHDHPHEVAERTPVHPAWL